MITSASRNLRSPNTQIASVTFACGGEETPRVFPSACIGSATPRQLSLPPGNRNSLHPPEINHPFITNLSDARPSSMRSSRTRTASRSITQSAAYLMNHVTIICFNRFRQSEPSPDTSEETIPARAYNRIDVILLLASGVAVTFQSCVIRSLSWLRRLQNTITTAK